MFAEKAETQHLRKIQIYIGSPNRILQTPKEHITRQPNAGRLRAWHFDGRRPLLLLEVDVPHVHAEAPAEGILLVLHDLGIDRQGLRQARGTGLIPREK